MKNRKIFINFFRQYYYAKGKKSIECKMMAAGMLIAFRRVILELYNYTSIEYTFISKFEERENR